MISDAILQSLLRAPLALTEARRMTAAKGEVTRDGIVPTPRLLLLSRGSIDYQIESRTHRFTAPALLLVPALSRRQWIARNSVTLLFFAFDSNPPPGEMVPLQVGGHLAKEQIVPMRHIISLFERDASPLLIEAEVKAILGRFFTHARPITKAGAAPSPSTRGLEQAIEWLSANLTLADPLNGLHERAGLSQAYFRSAFRRLVGVAPREHLNALRMRAARFHLRETNLPVKQVARILGFADPLYFSRRYHQFWQCWPTDERAG